MAQIENTPEEIEVADATRIIRLALEQAGYRVTMPQAFPTERFLGAELEGSKTNGLSITINATT